MHLSYCRNKYLTSYVSYLNVMLVTIADNENFCVCEYVKLIEAQDMLSDGKMTNISVEVLFIS